MVCNIECQMICQNTDHKESQIQGICVDRQCKTNPFVCFECIKFNHFDHKEKVLQFKDIFEKIEELKQTLISIGVNHETYFKQTENIINYVFKNQSRLKPYFQIDQILSEQKIIKEICYTLKNYIHQLEDCFQFNDQSSFYKLKQNIQQMKQLYNIVQYRTEFQKLKIKSCYIKQKYQGIIDSIQLFPQNIDQSLQDFQLLIQDIQSHGAFLTSFYFSQTHSLTNIQIQSENIVKCDNSIVEKLKQMISQFLSTETRVDETNKLEKQDQEDKNLNQNKDKQLNLTITLIFISINMQFQYFIDNSKDKEICGISKFKDTNLQELSKDQIIINKSPTINNIYIQTLIIKFYEKNQQGNLQKSLTVKAHKPDKLNINQQQEFLLIDGYDKQKSNSIQDSNNKEINEQSIQIIQENTNEEQNNLNEQEQIQLDYQQQQQNQQNNQLLYQTQQIVNVEQYHNIIQLILRKLLFQQQNENEIMINSLDYEDHRNIEIKELNNLEHQQHINNQILLLEQENQYNLLNQENRNNESIEQDYNFYLDYLKNQIINEEIYQDQSIENIEENCNNQDYEDHRNIEIEEINNLDHEQNINNEVQEEEHYEDLNNAENHTNETVVENNSNQDHEDHGNIQIEVINHLEHEQHINNELLEEEQNFNLFYQENNNIDKIEEDKNFYLINKDDVKNKILDREEDNQVENIEERNNNNFDYEEHRNIEIEENIDNQ